MAQKYNIKLNVEKLSRAKTETRTYKNKDNEEITIREMKLDVVILNPEMHKKLATSNNKDLVKVGFVAGPSTRDENGQWANGETIGDVTEWRASKPSAGEVASKGYEGDIPGINYKEDINLNDIPF